MEKMLSQTIVKSGCLCWNCCLGELNLGTGKEETPPPSPTQSWSTFGFILMRVEEIRPRCYICSSVVLKMLLHCTVLWISFPDFLREKGAVIVSWFYFHPYISALRLVLYKPVRKGVGYPSGSLYENEVVSPVAEKDSSSLSRLFTHQWEKPCPS